MGLTVVVNILICFNDGFLNGALSAHQTTVRRTVTRTRRHGRRTTATLTRRRRGLTRTGRRTREVLISTRRATAHTGRSVLTRTGTSIRQVHTDTTRSLDSRRTEIVQRLRRHVTTLTLRQTRNRLPGHLGSSIRQHLISTDVTVLKKNRW